ncbi:MAG: hypothetical protein HRT77_00845 [Halioglobus sp.]|nr:hypothetical protein [Halioglobus sp.]
MVPPGIRETISAAIRAEQASHQLRASLERRLPALRQTLQLPERQPLAALMAFITGYIESVPSCLAVVTSLSKRLGFFDYAAPFLRLAEDYFLQPPEPLPQDGGLGALLDEAFLCHRLLEEVNDHHIRHLQRPLLPLDMTEANIIVHHLLGDAFASRLEELVQFTAMQLLEKDYVWQQVRDLPGSHEASVPLMSSKDLVGSERRIRLRLAS